MFQELTNVQIDLKYNFCAVCDDIVQLKLCCVVVKQGFAWWMNVYDKYAFVNKSNLNLNKSNLNLNSCVMLGFVLIFACFTCYFPFAEEIAGRENFYVLLMCFPFRGILFHCKGLELLCENCLLRWALNVIEFK